MRLTSISLSSDAGPVQATVSRKANFTQPTSNYPCLKLVTPGPGSYRADTTFGKNSSSMVRTEGSGNMGTSTRYKGVTMYNPTPSQGPIYNFESSLGKQQTSTRPSAANLSFGTSTRSSALMQYGIWSSKPL